MKKKFFGFLTAILTLGVLGGTAFVAASDNIQKEEAAYAVEMKGGEVLYLKPNSKWTQDSARFAIYVFGTGNAWESMTECKNDAGIYEATVPTGTWTNVIFCRMKSGTTTNNWDNKWNQTGNLTYDSTKNLYTIKDGSWDSGNWSLFKTSEMVVDEFVDTYMHMDITHNPDDPDTEACKGNNGYYALAKPAFVGLTPAQKELFATGADYANAWLRFNRWAKANGEEINDKYEFVKSSNVAFLVQNNSLYVFIIIAIGAISLVVLFYAIKRKRQTI